NGSLRGGNYRRQASGRCAQRTFCPLLLVVIRDWSNTQRAVAPLGAKTESPCSYCPNPGIPIPPVIFDISELAMAFPCSIACLTPLNSASSRNSTSSGSTISFAILIEITSPAPLATTVIFPPAACFIQQGVRKFALGAGG